VFQKIFMLDCFRLFLFFVRTRKGENSGNPMKRGKNGKEIEWKIVRFFSSWEFIYFVRFYYMNVLLIIVYIIVENKVKLK
jgi:hypothetical protein